MTGPIAKLPDGTTRTQRGFAQRVLDALIDMREEGAYPSQRDLAERLGASPTLVAQAIKRLELVGAIKREAGKARTLVPQRLDAWEVSP